MHVFYMTLIGLWLWVCVMCTPQQKLRNNNLKTYILYLLYVQLHFDFQKCWYSKRLTDFAYRKAIFKQSNGFSSLVRAQLLSRHIDLKVIFETITTVYLPNMWAVCSLNTVNYYVNVI